MTKYNVLPLKVLRPMEESVDPPIKQHKFVREGLINSRFRLADLQNTGNSMMSAPEIVNKSDLP